MIDWFLELETNEIALVGIAIAAIGSIVVPTIFHFWRKTSPPKGKDKSQNQTVGSSGIGVQVGRDNKGPITIKTNSTIDEEAIKRKK